MIAHLNRMEAPLVTRAYSYIRFSSKKQQKGESFRRQFEFPVEVCRENGWVLDESLTLNDLGVSPSAAPTPRSGLWLRGCEEIDSR